MLIHKMRLDDNMAVLDVNSGAVHLVDEVIYDLLDYYDGSNDEAAVAALKDRYSEEDLRDALEELHGLQEEGLLFSPAFDVPPTFSETPILKSLCLPLIANSTAFSAVSCAVVTALLVPAILVAAVS